PLLLLAALAADPPRRAGLSQFPEGSSLRAFLTKRRRSLGLFVGAAGCLIVAVQAINHLVALALEWQFDAGPDASGRPTGAMVLLSPMGCLPLAWWLDRWLARRLDRAARPLIMGACVVIAVPVLATLAAAGSLERALAVVALTLFATSTANALVPTLLQDLAPAALRA